MIAKNVNIIFFFSHVFSFSPFLMFSLQAFPDVVLRHNIVMIIDIDMHPVTVEDPGSLAFSTRVATQKKVSHKSDVASAAFRSESPATVLFNFSLLASRY